ncbi:hypothetical protein GCM10009720_28300 [Yaniella flava]|uniref:Type I-E CRISPR-associated protein Cse1/CasA n=1 Tax=Yaniella flava TaxID=287930 RepID=A0ABP5GH50_9MICC
MTATESFQQPSFNLIDSPWVLCTDTHGDTRKLSLVEVFQQADDIVRLAGESATQDMAVFRTLLVIFWRANHTAGQLNSGDAEDIADWWLERFWGETDIARDIMEYFSAFRERFDLLHPITPFMQVSDLATPKDTSDGLEKLIPDSENDYFSMRAGSGLQAIDFDEAARWLLHQHSWNYAGIKPGVIGDERVKSGKSFSIGTGWSGRSGGIILHGRNLRESLLLNTNPQRVFGEDHEYDLPAWERPQGVPGTHGREHSTGPCDLLTWQVRRVRLFVEDDKVVGILATNGDKLDLKNHFNDPMTAYRYSKPQSKKNNIVHMPKAHSATRTMWRGIEPLLTREGVVEGPAETRDHQPATLDWLREVQSIDQDALQDTVIGVELIGQEYGSNDSVYVSTIHEEIPMRLVLLADKDETAAHLLVTAADATMQAAINVGQFAGNLSVAAGGDYVFSSDATDAVLHQLNDPFKRWLTGYEPSKDLVALRRAWFDFAKQTIIRYAQGLIRGAGPGAIIGREHDDRYISAATAWNMLIRQLDKRLPTRTSHQESADQPATGKAHA